jgi:hypothetical protein
MAFHLLAPSSVDAVMEFMEFRSILPHVHCSPLTAAIA